MLSSVPYLEPSPVDAIGCIGRGSFGSVSLTLHKRPFSDYDDGGELMLTCTKSMPITSSHSVSARSSKYSKVSCA